MPSDMKKETIIELQSMLCFSVDASWIP